MQRVHDVLVHWFLTAENRGAKFVAWNANRFDSYYVAAALVADDRFVMRPFLSKSNALRGLRVQRRGDSERAAAWMFLDGLAMLGLEGVSLEKFLGNFAPDHAKRTDLIDFHRGDTFDPDNPLHRQYALRDSEGLYHAMVHAESILIEHFDQTLGVTMGGACIKIFQANIPRDVSVKPLSARIESVFRDYVMRGGYCWCARSYVGPVWKYDVNQAYAAAMRDYAMPCGDPIEYARGIDWAAPWYIARVTATHARNRVPFYVRSDVGGRLRSMHVMQEIPDTWLTCHEVQQLQREGWQIDVRESVCWPATFTMHEYVNRLERLRTTCQGGPKGPIGTMAKAVGNHSFGKTAENLLPIEFMICATMPPGDDWFPYYGDSLDEPLQHVWARFTPDAPTKDYHAIQIASSITAAVRMQVRRAALLDPDAWLYADTDCVMFTRDMTAHLDIDTSRYGAWKVEDAGKFYRVIAKKVYAAIDDSSRSAKAMRVNDLTVDDFALWQSGYAPMQAQVQRNNFLRVLQGVEMFRRQVRSGTAVAPSVKFRFSGRGGRAGAYRCLGCGCHSPAFCHE